MANRKLTEAELAKLNRLRKEFPYYAEHCLKIRTKEGKLEPFLLNYTQRKINDKIEELRIMKKPVRIIVLKARQMGVSTLVEGMLFHRTSFRELINSLIVAHKEDASTNLFNMSKLFYEEMPTALRPSKKASNAKELIFENPENNPVKKQKNPGLRSKIKIDTAGNTGAGRSDTIHNLHASEVAFWPNAEITMLGLMQAVPNIPGTMVVLESTANGVGGYFYDTWHKAVKGENGFVPMFFAWHEHLEYQINLTNEEQKAWEAYCQN